MGKNDDRELIIRIGDDDHVHTHLLGLTVKAGVFVMPFRTAENAVDCLRLVIEQIRRATETD